MKILLPVDGSPGSLAAVRHALTWAEAGLPVAVVLVNVQEPPSFYEVVVEVVVAHNAELIDRVRRAAGLDQLREAEALVKAAQVDRETEVIGGDPRQRLIEAIETHGCDAVVMGARGHGADGAGGLGSVALAVLQHSPVPVTVVPLAVDAEVASDEPVDDAIDAD
jgi:nucleotide-binding universal stress UspA family protein